MTATNAKSNQTVQVPVRLPVKTRDKLKRAAARDKRSMNGAIEKLIEDYVR